MLGLPSKLRRCWSQAQHSYLIPQLSLGIFHPDPHVASRLMAQNKIIYQRCIAAHEYTQEHTDGLAATLKKLLKDLQFPRWQVALEWWGACQAESWDATSQELRDVVSALYAGPSNTKWSCEDAFAHLTHCATASNKGYAKMNKCFGSVGFV